MSKKAEDLFDEALSLPPVQRAELVDRLLASLESSRNPTLDELWAQEAEDRLDAFERGEVKAVSSREVFRATKPAKP